MSVQRQGEDGGRGEGEKGKEGEEALLMVSEDDVRRASFASAGAGTEGGEEGGEGSGEAGGKQFMEQLQAQPYTAYVLGMMVLVYLMNQFDRYLLAVSQIPHVDYDGVQYALLAGPIFTVVYTISGIFIGRLGEVRRVPLLAICLAFWSVMTLLIASTTRFWEVALLRFGLGVGQAGCVPFATGLLGEYFAQTTRGTALGIFNIGIYTGYGLALGLGTWLYDEMGWKGPYLIAGFTGLGVSVALFFTVKERKPRTASSSTRASSLEFSADEKKEAEAAENGGDANGDSNSNGGRRAGSAVDFQDVMKHWLRTPSLILLCIAGGVRNAGGYVWGNYTAIFFSPFYSKYDDQDGDCTWSYNSTYTGKQVCDDDYPYCIGTNCKAVSDNPWHDEGMSHTRFESFMSWIPLVAGSMGAILGGYISDILAKRYRPGGRGYRRGGDQSAAGAMARVWIVIISNILAAPFAAMALLLPYPWCFLVLIGSNVIGEMWVGTMLAVIVDLVPRRIQVTSIAIYLFIITNIGGNASILVPVIKDAYDTHYTYHFKAAPEIGSPEWDSGFSDKVPVRDRETGAEGLRDALLWLFPGVYAVSSVFMLVAFFFLKRDVERAQHESSKDEEFLTQALLDPGEEDRRETPITPGGMGLNDDDGTFLVPPVVTSSDASRPTTTDTTSVAAPSSSKRMPSGYSDLYDGDDDGGDVEPYVDNLSESHS